MSIREPSRPARQTLSILLLLSLLALLITPALAQSNPSPAHPSRLNPRETPTVTKTVGTTGADYATLALAFAGINSGALTGAIQLNVIDNTTEPAAGAILNASGSGSASYTSVLIQPSGGAARTISGAATAGLPLIDLNGADNVTIDGLNTGGNSLTIANTTVSATSGTSTIRFIGGATNNTVTNATISGSFNAAVATNGGNIYFATDAVTANGNDNNTISNNNIGPAGANLPTKGVYSNGSTTTTALFNSNNTISGNNIYDYFGAAVASAGVYIAGGSTDFTVSNNKFYQTATRTQTTGAQHSAIWITGSSGNNHQITGNTIGFANSAGTGTYTFVGVSSSSVLIPIYLAVGTTTATSVQGNTIAGISMSGAVSGTSSSAAFRGIYVSSGLTTIGNVTGNTIGSLSTAGSISFSSSSASAADVYGIFNFGSSNANYSNNNIGGFSLTNTSTGEVVFMGIRNWTLTTATTTIANNTIGGAAAGSITNNATATASRVLGIQTEASTPTMTGNTIRNMSMVAGNTGTIASAAVIGINQQATSTAGAVVSQNTIYALSNSHATAAVWVTGLNYNGPSSGTNLIARNLIYGLTTPSTSTSATVNGIYVQVGNTTYQNNMIALGSDLTANSPQINGINEVGGTDNFYHNSVYIGGASVAAGSASSFAFNSAITSNTRAYRNNIFYNARSNGAATGKHYAIQVGGAAANPPGLTTNNNVLYAPGTGGYTGRFNALDQTTLANWQAATGQDANSFSADPQFLAPAAATPDLHINPSVATVAEGNGFLLASVTDDYDGQTRATLTPVDIGADAGNFVGIDLSAPVITYTALGNTTSTGDRALVATITDVTGVPTSGVLQPRIYYKKNAGSWFSSQGSLASGTGANGVWNFTIVAAAMGGLTAGDTVSYYVIAQDTAPTPNIGSNPAGAVATDVNTVTTPPATSNSYTILAAISGTKYVGSVNSASCPALDYATITAAVAALNGAVLTSPTTFILCDSSYAGETFPITINANGGSSASNTVTIKPYTGLTTAVSGSSATALIVLNGIDYLTLDGSNSGGATRDWTLTNTSTGASSAVIWGQTTSGSDAVTNNTVKNVILTGNSNTTTLFGIGFGSSTISTSSLGTGNNSNTVQNCAISKVQYGIYSQGASAANKNQGTVITQNLMNAASPNNVAKGGILLGYENNVQITQNVIDGLAQTSSPDVVGIAAGLSSISTSTYTGNEVTNATITRNVIGSVRNTGTFSACGICVAPATSGTTLIANNVLTGVSANGTSGDFSVGILLGGGAGSTTQVYYNSVSMNGTQTGGSDKSYALAIGGSDPVVDVRNNALYNTQNNGTGSNYAIGYAYSTFANLTSNNNDFYVSTDAIHFVGATASLSSPTNQATLTNLQTATGKNAASLSADPQFNNPASNLQPQVGSPLVGAGTPVSVVIDINGVSRSATTPTIGAYETAVDTVGPVITYTALANTNSTANRTLAIVVTDASGAPTSGIGLPVIYFRKGISGAYASSQCSFVSGSNYNCLVDYSLVTGGSVTTGDTIQYYVAAQDNLGNVAVNPSTGAAGFSANPPAASTPPTTPNSYLISMAFSGTYTVPGSYPSLTNAGGIFEALNAGVLTGNVVINITADLTGETGTVPLNQLAEAVLDATFSVTIKPSGAARTITGTGSNSTVIKLNGADNVTIDGSLSGGSDRSLTISNPNTATGTSVLWIGSLGAGAGATNDTVKNCIISAGALGSNTVDTFGIFVGDTTGAANGADNDGLTIQNNQIKKASYGIQAVGGATAGQQNDNLLILGNTIGDAVVADSIGRFGILVGQATNATISQNTVQNVVANDNAISSTNNVTGILLSTGVTNSSLTRNNVSGVRYTGSSGYGGKGIDINTSRAASNLTVANNFVSDVRGDGWNSLAGDSVVGLRINGATGGVTLVYNSVNLGSGTFAGNSSGTLSAAFYADASTSGLTVRNNIFATNLVNSAAATAKSYAIATTATSSALFTAINTNDYYPSGTQGVLGLLNAVDRTTLAAWQTATGQDAGSIAADPLFVSATDLHITNLSSPAANAGVVIATITNDIDGDARDGSTPDIGADEFSPPPTATPTATPTDTPVPPTATPTDTPVPPTATPTDTPVPPTATPTDTPVPPTATPTATPVNGGPVVITDNTATTAVNDGIIGVGEYVGFSHGINNGFGNVIGYNSYLYVDSDGSGNLNLGLDLGGGALNDVVVIYIDSQSGGFSSTSGFTDVGDAHRAAISGLGTGGGASVLTFASGFTADYAIAFADTCCGGFAGLWQLQNGGSHTFITALTKGTSRINAANIIELSGLTMANLGSTPGGSFKYVATLLNPGNAYRANEFHGVAASTVPGGNIGANPVTLASGDYNVFNSFVPPTATPTDTPVPPTATPTDTPTPTPTATPTDTPVPPTATPTDTPVPPTATPTDTPTPTPTATPTDTPVPPTATPTDTPVPPTATPTDTPVPPTATPTNTPVPPTATPTPTATPLSGGLVINEVDYDQPGTDTAEFLELKNVSANPISLGGWSVVLINGGVPTPTPYATYNLPATTVFAMPAATIPPGGYYVICANSATVTPCDLDVTPDTNMIQNGAPDAIALYQGATLVDVLSYEGDTPGYTEGSGVGLIDDGVSVGQGISRFPDGVDTNQNNVDFSPRCITPGAANSASTCAPTPTPTVTPTNTPVPPTATPTDTPVPPTATPTDTPVPPTATPTDTPAPPTATPTDTPVPPTATPTDTPAPPTATPTDTPAPPTATPTDTPAPPTATPTDTPVPPTATPTDTPVPPTATPTDTPVVTGVELSSLGSSGSTPAPLSGWLIVALALVVLTGSVAALRRRSLR